MTRSRSDSNDGSRQARTLLLAADNKRSIIAEITGDRINSIAYSTYGQQSGQQAVTTELGFNGELREARLGWYLLGNGYRAYNPTLMRFHSPDSLSPFGKGGLNAYMYCVGDPVNASDPTGHMPKGLLSIFRKTSGKGVTNASSTSSLSQLVPANTSPVAERVGALSVSATASTPSMQTSTQNLGRSRVSDPTAMRNTEVVTPPLAPSTGESIYGTLPVGRRTWTPPSEATPPEGMMTYAEMSQQHSASGVRANNQGRLLSDGTRVVLDNRGMERIILPRTPSVVTDHRGMERIILGTPQQQNTNVRKP